AVDSKALLFLEGVPGGKHTTWGQSDPGQAVNAAHWYDILTLITKQFNPEFTIDFNSFQGINGREAVAQAFVDQLAHPKHESSASMGGIPTLIGEFGIPFDLDDKSAYKTGDFSTITYALDLYYDALDANLLNATIWNYTADNTNERGDGWNDEDLSIFSRDQQNDPSDLHSGGRGLKAIVRPYARATAGEPLRMGYDHETRVFEFEFGHDAAVTAEAETEIFVPDYVYPDGYQVELSDGTYEKQPLSLLVKHNASRERHTVRITPL
ncbi:MAG TPA: hypothetical protein VHL11_25445, partial [Phototrophicaceae bacterium]|nr:hypothetical protein [Phototrophicaceae bacterium]